MKLKTNKIYKKKKLRKKIRDQKNKDEIEEYNIW